MSDSELETWVQRAGNRVFVGFKSPGTERGVSARGERLVSQAEEATFRADLRSRGARFTHEYELIPAVVAELPPGLAGQIRHLPFVDYVEPILPGKRHVLQQDTTWNLIKVGTVFGWSFSRGSGVRILIIDSGREQNHPDLQGIPTHHCAGDGDWDNFGHGTLVLGIVGALDNSLGIIGGAPAAEVFMVKDGDEIPDPAGTACGVDWGRRNGVFVMNMSTEYGTPYQALTDEINGAYNEGRLIVASAGNDQLAVSYPANLPNVIAVGATTATDQRWVDPGEGSNFGDALELMAPGKDVISTTLPSGYGTGTGTSFAAPHVTYAAALVRAYNPSFTNVQVRQRLRETALDLGDSGFDIYYGYGRLSVAGALGNGGPDPILSVAITGPACIYTAGNASYTVETSSGTAPFQYAWHRDIAPYEENWEYLGSGQTRSVYWPGGSYSAHLRARVTDATGNIRESIVTVQVLTGGNLMAAVTAAEGEGGRDAKMCAGGGGGPY